MTTKNILIVVGVVVVLGLIWGAYQYPAQQTQIEQLGSSVGSTFGTAKLAAVNISPRDINSTSTSILNTDSSDRIVTDAFVTCSGLGSMLSSTGGVATFNWFAATSSVAAPTVSIAGNTFAAMNTTVATSSTDGFTATSTYTGTAVFGRRWNAGTYMVFQTNATSTGAACQAGVHYLAS